MILPKWCEKHEEYYSPYCEKCRITELQKELDQERKVVQSLARSYYKSEVRHKYRDKKYVAEVKSVKHAIEQARFNEKQ